MVKKMAKKKQPYRIAHLSDLHLTKSDNDARSEPNLFGPLKGMNAAFRKIIKSKIIQNSNLVLITGDITDRGDIDSWQVFWDAIKNAGLTKRLLIIPGNHDVCCLGARIPPLKKKAYRESDLQKAITGLKMENQPIKFPWVKTFNKRIAIIGLNSNNLGNFTAITNAMGEISHYQLVSFANKLYQYREVPVKIVVLHHSPNIPESATAKKRYGKDKFYLDRILGCIPQDQRRALRLLCLSHRVRLIVHGHLHIAEDRRVNGIRIIGAPATTEPLGNQGERRQYQLYTYTIRGNDNRIFSKLQGIIA